MGESVIQNLDVNTTEATWSALTGTVFVVQQEEEYQRLVALLV
jgi:hypothetical protein